MSENEWSEPLPENCPPTDAADPDDRIFYRLIATNPPTPGDFVSFRILFPAKVIPESECVVRALSVHDDLQHAKKKTMVGRFQSYHVAEMTLPKGCGLVKKTRSRHHWSWWMRKSFNPLNHYKTVEQ